LQPAKEKVRAVFAARRIKGGFRMTIRSFNFMPRTLLFAGAAALLLTPFAALAQTASNPPAEKQQAASSKEDRWLHVRVINKESKGEVVRVNVPIELAEKILPTINKDRLHNGKVRIDNVHPENVDVDLRALIDAVRTAKDGEYVTVQNNDQNIRVAKNAGYIYVNVSDKDNKEGAKGEKVEVKVPMKVIDALFSAGKDELDLVAALRALSAAGDSELVSVKDHDNDIRVWMDSKNVSDEKVSR
jgi:hypothetical protein